MKRLTHLAVLSGLLISLNGCAVFNRQNTPALNMVEKHLVPKEQPGRALSYPLIIPVGAVAATMDMFIFHPVSVISDAWDDTEDMLWKKLDWDKQYATTTASIIPRTTLTPVVLTTDFLVRSCFDIGRRGNTSGTTVDKSEYARRQQERKNQEMMLVKQAEDAFNAGRLEVAITSSEKALALNHYQYQAAAIKACALLKSGKLEPVLAMPVYQNIFKNEAFMILFAEKLSGASPHEAIQLLSLLERNHYYMDATARKPLRQPAALGKQPLVEQATHGETKLLEAVKKSLRHEDRAIQLKTVQVLVINSRSFYGFKQLLLDVANGPDPVLAFVARNKTAR